MSSNDNPHGRVVELMVENDNIQVVREREQTEQLFSLENILPD